MHGRVKEYFHALSSALDRAKCLVSCPSGFTPGMHQIGDWMGDRTCVDAEEKSKISAHMKNQTLNPAHSKVNLPNVQC
jgi:hypothetical protein